MPAEQTRRGQGSQRLVEELLRAPQVGRDAGLGGHQAPGRRQDPSRLRDRPPDVLDRVGRPDARQMVIEERLDDDVEAPGIFGQAECVTGS